MQTKMGFESLVGIVVGVVLGILQVIYWYAEALFRQFVPPPMKPIDGETILITGAVGGIGKEICRNLVKSGNNIKLVIWDLNKAELDKFAGELESIGAPGLKVFPFAVDISVRENIDTASQQVKDTVGRITIIFNNAGIMIVGNFLQHTNDEIQKTIDINLTSHLWIIRQFLPEMVANNHGRIVNTCSIAGLKGAENALPYFASKFGVNGYTESLKMELQNSNFKYDGIKLTTVYPYFVQTPLIKSMAIRPEGASKLPYGFNKFCTPENVGKKMVEGMRREYEYIYFPSVIPLMCCVEYLLPLKARKWIDVTFVNTKNFIFKDANEQKRCFDTPLHASVTKCR